MNEVEQGIHSLVDKARLAQEQIASYSQLQVHNMCRSVAWQVYKDANIAECARTACQETGMGIYEDKLKKHKVKVLGALTDVLHAKTVGLIEEDQDKKIKKYAKPVGVVGAITPVTNPTATPASNAISILAGRNAVIFGPHPRSKKSARVVCEFMRKGLRKVGAPEDLVQWVEEPTLELSQELMHQVDLVVATGGAGVVKAAYSSGTPAYGVGAGNAIPIVAEDADIEEAAEKICISKTFDNATSCSSENSVIIQKSKYNAMIDEFKKHGGYLCNPEEKEKLENWMWVPGKKGNIAINPEVVAVSARKIAADAGLNVPETTTMLMVECDQPDTPSHWHGEKLSPVISLWKYHDFEEALDCLINLTNYAGLGHSCGIYTWNQQYIDMLAEEMKTSRLVVRQPMAPANGGNFFNGMPSTTTLGCGTWGGNVTTENIHWKHFLNITWVSEPFEPQKPTEEETWGEFWKEYGED